MELIKKMDDLYQFILFAHILSAFVMFSLWIFEFMLIFKSEEGSASWRSMVKFAGLLQMICMILVFASGAYLMRTAWGPQPWLATSVVLLISTIPISIALRVLAKRKKEVAGNTLHLIQSIYKVGTALVILMLMVFKSTEYELTLLSVLTSYLVIFGFSLGAYLARGRKPDF